MNFETILKTQNVDALLTIIDILSVSGLNEKYWELAVISFKLKTMIGPEKKICNDKMEIVKECYKKLSTEAKDNLNQSCSMIKEKNFSNINNLVEIDTDYLRFDFSDLETINKKLILELEDAARLANRLIKEKSGYGNEFLGWLDLPLTKTKEINDTADFVKNNSDAVVFIGIGGSYLGAKAVLTALLPDNHNLMASTSSVPEIYFAGQNLSTKFLSDMLLTLKNKKVTLVPISKSGTTTEPAVAFRILYSELIKAGNSVNVIAITDRTKGSLKEESIKNNWKTFVIPDDVGGRFSVLSPVGLLPLAISGIKIDMLLEGAKSIMAGDHLSAIKYAVYRQAKHILGKEIEILSCWSPYLTQLGEWWKQLFGESEGKNGKGIFVASATFTTDLHSIGQLIQDGKRNFFETFLNIEKVDNSLQVSAGDMASDPISYLVGMSPDYINQKAFEGTKEAHNFGKTPSITITLKNFDEKSIGALFYFWEYSCAISAYMQGTNPFDQPGVEEYKKRMFKLLGK